MRTGLIEGLSMDDYQNDPAYSAGDLIRMGESFRKWKYFKENKKPPTRAMVVGSATGLILESKLTKKPHLISSQIAIYSDGSSKTKGFEKFCAERKEAYCLDEDEFSLSDRCVDAVLAEPECMKYLDGAIAEPSIFVTDPEFGFRRKCRPDFLHIKQGVSINIKTTTDASEYGFTRSIADFAYDWQTLNYQDVLRLHFDRSFDEIHILVEKADEGPLTVRIRGIDDDTLEQARGQVFLIREKLAAAIKNQKFEDAPACLEVSTIPAWARRLAQL